MSRVKIFLDKGETLEQAESDLFKALNHHASGEVHKEGFQDPAIEDACQFSNKLHEKIYKEMLKEIFEVVEKEYRK